MCSLAVMLRRSFRSSVNPDGRVSTVQCLEASVSRSRLRSIRYLRFLACWVVLGKETGMLANQLLCIWLRPGLVFVGDKYSALRGGRLSFGCARSSRVSMALTKGKNNKHFSCSRQRWAYLTVSLNRATGRCGVCGASVKTEVLLQDL